MYVFSDSVLCLAGKCPTRPTPGHVCENQRLFSFVSTPEFCQLHDIAGEPIVCKWRIYSGQSTIQIFVKIEKMLQSESVNSFHLKSRINFMPMYNDIDWTWEDARKQYANKIRLVSQPMPALFS